MSDGPILLKSKTFALQVIEIYKYLVEEKREYVLSKQFLRSGTSIGANAREGARAQSKPDFISKMSIALKEADETMYWIELLTESKYLDKDMALSAQNSCNELIRILVSIVKTSRQNE